MTLRLTAEVVLPTPPFWFASAMVTAPVRATRGSARSMIKATSRGYNAGLPGRRAPLMAAPLCADGITRRDHASTPTGGFHRFRLHLYTYALRLTLNSLLRQSCTHTIVPSGAQPNIQEATGNGRLMQPCDIGWPKLLCQ